MSGVADGATIRKERMLELLDWINSMQPEGPTQTQVQQHMSLVHGLTFTRTTKYLYELTLMGVVRAEAAHFKIREAQYRKYIKIAAPERENREVLDSE